MGTAAILVPRQTTLTPATCTTPGPVRTSIFKTPVFVNGSMAISSSVVALRIPPASRSFSPTCAPPPTTEGYWMQPPRNISRAFPTLRGPIIARTPFLAVATPTWPPFSRWWICSRNVRGWIWSKPSIPPTMGRGARLSLGGATSLPWISGCSLRPRFLWC